MNAHYRKLKEVNESLYAYHYDLEDDTKVVNLETGETSVTKSFICYRLNREKKIARIMIELCLPDMNKEIDVAFANNRMCTSMRSPLKKSDETIYMDPEGFDAMFLPGGVLDLFNFSVFDVQNLEVIQAGDEIIYKGIGYNPAYLSGQTNFQPLSDIETGKYIIADAKTYVIERAEAVKFTKVDSGGVKMETEGIVKAKKIGVNDQVKIELPKECYE